MSYAELGKPIFTAPEVLSHRALNKEVDKVRKKKEGIERSWGAQTRSRRRLGILLRNLKRPCGGSKRIRARSVVKRREKVVVVAGWGHSSASLGAVSLANKKGK